MTVIFETSYSLPVTDYPTTHARIGHSLNWLSGGTATASSTATGYYADGPLNSLTYERWSPSSVTATWEYTHGTSQECDYCAIAAHTMGTNGNTLTVQYHDGATWQDVGSEAITTDEPIFVIFAPQTATRWRISIASGTAPEVGVIKFGTALQMARPIFGGHTPSLFARATVLRSNYSETGEFLGRTTQRKSYQVGYDWQHLDQDWMRQNWTTMQKAVETEPFFVAWRPGDFDDVIFGMTDQSPVPQNMGIRGLMSVGLSMTGRGYD